MIEAAFEAFRTQGFEATRMDRIASVAGVTRTSLYRRFPGKGELLAEVIRRQSGLLYVETATPGADREPPEGI